MHIHTSDWFCCCYLLLWIQSFYANTILLVFIQLEDFCSSLLVCITLSASQHFVFFFSADGLGCNVIIGSFHPIICWWRWCRGHWVDHGCIIVTGWFLPWWRLWKLLIRWRRGGWWWSTMWLYWTASWEIRSKSPTRLRLDWHIKRTPYWGYFIFSWKKPGFPLWINGPIRNWPLKVRRR